MLSLSVDHFFTLILPRRPTGIQTLPSPPSTGRAISDRASFGKRRRINGDTGGPTGSPDDFSPMSRKRVKVDNDSVSSNPSYPRSPPPPIPAYIDPSTNFSSPTLSSESILGSDDMMKSCDTIKPSLTAKYFAPIDRSDLIICSQEDSSINFYVGSRTVFMASPVLQLQTVHYGYLRAEAGTKRAVLALDEPSQDIEAILRLIYTRTTKPRVDSSEALCHLLDLCQRYGMAQASHFLCSTALRDLARENPLRAYGIACRFSLQSEIPSISREILRVDLSKADLGFDLAYCTPKQVQKLLSFHKRHSLESIKIISEASAEGLTCDGEYCEGGVAEWWLEVVKNSRSLLRRRPTTEQLFSSEFLAGCCRKASLRCSQCPLSFLSSRSQHKLAIVKDQVDSLPCTL